MKSLLKTEKSYKDRKDNVVCKVLTYILNRFKLALDLCN